MSEADLPGLLAAREMFNETSQIPFLARIDAAIATARQSGEGREQATKLEPNPEWEALADAYHASQTAEHGVEPEATLTMLEKWKADTEPANHLGQVTFSRAMLDSATDALRATLATIAAPRASAGTFDDGVTQAARDVLAERERHKTVEGWTEAHDDTHVEGDMARAAACYALVAANYPADDRVIHRFWPWLDAWWKPTNPRRDLVKAGALIIAEIERLDRALTQKDAPK